MADYTKEIRVLKEATEAAVEATNKYLAEGHDWFPCGFAWVVISPATSRIAKAAKQLGIGKTASYFKGLHIWNPSGIPTQEMDAKMAGARAFVKILELNGYEGSYADCRMD